VVAVSPLADGSQPWQAEAHKHVGWIPPIAFAPDNLTNNELGWKTMWLDYRIQWDGALYQEDWNDAQIGAVGAGVNGGSNITVNGGNYRVRGVETFVVAHLTPGLTIEGGGNWNHSELVKEATFVWADGTPINFSLLQTPTGKPFPNPGGTLGSPLAGAPPFQGNIRARYELSLSGYDAFAQFSAVHQAHSIASTNRLTPDLKGNSTAYDLPAFTSYDGAVGFGKDSWLVQVYGENLTDTRAQLYANYAQWYKAVTVSRPRTIGLRYSYKFSGR
jgi:iron complex outermembrane recepter protein